MRPAQEWPRPVPATDFASSFEVGEPQPACADAVDRATNVTRGGPDGGPGMRTYVTGGPDTAYSAKTSAGFTGTKSMGYAGHHVSAGHGHSASRIFPVDVRVTPTTRLAYKIFPRLMSPDRGTRYPSPSTYVAVDLAFSDGTRLRDLGATDQHGFGLTGQAQGAAKVLYANQWNSVSSDIGRVAAGKTITQILLVYERVGAPGDFAGWIDDLSIAGHPEYIRHAHLSDWVVTTRGTNSSPTFSRGNNVPAAAVPHGFNLWTPVTDAASANWLYQYQAQNNAGNLPMLQAFALSHQPSPWAGDRNTFQLMPGAGPGTPDPDRNARALAFQHDHEVAKPHYYSVTFINGMRAEIAPTDHAAIFRFTFTGDRSTLIFDNVTNEGGLTLDPPNQAIAGYTDVGTGGSTGTTRMFIHATVDRTVTGGGMLPHSGRPDVTGYLQFDTSIHRTVTLRIATSLISLAQARHNLQLEIPATDSFGTVKTRAQRLWDSALGVIEDVEGATPDQLTTLYSNLYRVNLYPSSGYENAGTAAHPRYEHASAVAAPAGPSTPAHTGARIVPGVMYLNNGFWDTYRTAWPAYVLLFPAHAGRMIDGWVNQYKEGGWIARWAAPGYSDSMLGTNSDVAIADAYAKGVTNFDVTAAYEAAVKNASVATSNPAVGRHGLSTSIFLGYTPASTSHGMSWAMEDYLNDFGIAVMSRLLYQRTGKQKYKDNCAYFLNRALGYVHHFDPNVGFFQGRHPGGSWRLPPRQYDPRVWGGDYIETNGWGMGFAVPHDGQGLAFLYGGRRRLADKLDQFFSTPETARFPGFLGAVSHEMREAAAIQMGQWGLSNEPGFHIPYMYMYAGEPHKAQSAVREALARLFTGSDIGQGYPGDEDNGAMSAWYIFSALGFYPLQNGTPYYVIGSPLFTSATICLENGKKIVVRAPNNSSRNVYVQSLRVNGKRYDKTYLPHTLLARGAILDFELGPRPSAWGARRADAPVSVSPAGRAPRPWRDLTGPGYGTAEGSGGADVHALFDNTADTEVTFQTPTPTVTWRFAGGGPRRAVYYTLTSANTDGDPSSWALQGSRDGRRWITVDRRSHEEFQWRRHTRAFSIARPGAYERYRLKVTANSGAPNTSLAQIELLGPSP